MRAYTLQATFHETAVFFGFETLPFVSKKRPKFWIS
jgi:hypothetical protein